MNEPLDVGDRIELIDMPEDPCPVEPGTRGTIGWINPSRGPRGPFTQYHVDWDNGRSLMLLVPPDKYRKLGESDG